MFSFRAIIGSIFEFIWKYKTLCFIVLLIYLLFLRPHHSRISIDGTPYNFQLSVATKLMALREREKYFSVWIDQIIAPDIQAPEEKLKKIFDWIDNLKEPPKGFSNIEQHEYYILINQYGCTNHRVRVFCVLVTVAGYQAIPFQNEADGRVIVRIPGTDEKWLECDLKNKIPPGKEIRGIELSKKVREDIRAIDTVFKKFWERKYTRGDQNILVNRIVFEVLKLFGLSPKYIDALNNNTLLPLTY